MDQKLLTLLLTEWNRLSQLPIRLTVELVCLDEDSTALLGRLEKDEVGGNALVLHNLDDLSDLDVLGGDRHDSAKALLLTLQDSILSIVQFFVPAIATEIVPSLFTHGH